MAAKVSHLVFSCLFPKISEETGSVKSYSAHRSLSEIFLASENSYKMKSPYYEYSRVFQHSEGKLHSYVSHYLHQDIHYIKSHKTQTSVFAVTFVTWTNFKQGLYVTIFMTVPNSTNTLLLWHLYLELWLPIINFYLGITCVPWLYYSK